jgi:hypothetical protein
MPLLPLLLLTALFMAVSAVIIGCFVLSLLRTGHFYLYGPLTFAAQ